MPKPIIVTRGGKATHFQLKRVDRSKLYGKRRRIPLDPAGKPCARAAITDDGALLVRAGMTAQGYFDEGGAWIPNGALVGLDADGTPLEKVPSTLGESRELEGPVPATELLDTRVSAVYALQAEAEAEADVDGDGDGDGAQDGGLDQTLLKSLREGALYRFEFGYRSDYRADTAFLVANDEGDIFALVGQPLETEWVDPAEAVVGPFADDAEDEEDDLDFEMF